MDECSLDVRVILLDVGAPDHLPGSRHLKLRFGSQAVNRVVR
jgi:hypothetical protein